MLAFFRRFQKSIFLIITCVIVVSFSFFGTYQAFRSPPNVVHEVEFVDLQGQEITSQQIDLMARFISSDVQDVQNLGHVFAGNFLNDGVLRKDFFATGLGALVYERVQDQMDPVLEQMFVREQAKPLFRLPSFPLISLEMLWGYFAKDLQSAYHRYLASDSASRFARKVDLYTAESLFPQSRAKQILYYQMQQSRWGDPDADLLRADLSLFGYHFANDWFGKDYVRSIARLIYQMAARARALGYVVSADEALDALQQQARGHYEKIQNMSGRGFAQLFSEHVRMLGTDVSGVTQIWQQILLIRKMLADVQGSVMVSRDSVHPFTDFAQELVELTLYTLPPGLEFRSLDQVMALEVYVDLVGRETDEFRLPKTYYAVEEVEDSRVILKTALIEVAELDHRDLYANMSVKEVWDWQLSDQGFAKIREEYPEVALKKATTREARKALIDSLDASDRERLDQKSRMWIVRAHPEWIEEALLSKAPRTERIRLYQEGDVLPLDVAMRASEFYAMFEAFDPQWRLVKGNREKTYRVRMVEPSSAPEIVRFSQAQEDRVLEPIVKERLKKGYDQMVSQKHRLVMHESRGVLPFDEVREIVAQEVFRSALRHIERFSGKVKNMDELSQQRFRPYLEYQRTLAEPRTQRVMLPVEASLGQVYVLEEQFALIQQEEVYDRSSQKLPITFEQIRHQEPHKISEVMGEDGRLFLYRVHAFGKKKKEDEVRELLTTLRTMVSQPILLESMEGFFDELVEQRYDFSGRVEDATSVEA